MYTESRQHFDIRLDELIIQIIRSSDLTLKQKGLQLVGLVKRYYSVARQRNALRELTDEQLKDIGISRVDALREANKPFWKE
jgi:uncharacterized protein YjiS (DUF1127 family)